SVVPGGPAPTGTVTFSFGDGTPDATAPLTGGVATTTHAYATRLGSPFLVTAAYNGSPQHQPSTTADRHTVDQTATTTTVTTTPDPSATGQTVTATATVTPQTTGTAAPTGTVTFTFGDGTPAATATLTAGVATATRTYTTAAPAPYTVTASYGGDTNHAASSAVDGHTVTRQATTVTVASTPNPSSPGAKVTVTATVTATPPATGTPTGTVVLVLGDRNPQVVPLTGGVATASFNPVKPGAHTLTASYSGSATSAPSTGTGTHTVT
ncbi:Ig-like domain repeat protein, partial [Streptomyces sp. ME03-5709C]|nr:Ig-like domain repeat protein [Streptomyces sp. ME03-5709C]